MPRKCQRTVSRVTNKVSAISWFLYPLATKPIISFSRVVSLFGLASDKNSRTRAEMVFRDAQSSPSATASKARRKVAAGAERKIAPANPILSSFWQNLGSSSSKMIKILIEPRRSDASAKSAKFVVTRKDVSATITHGLDCLQTLTICLIPEQLTTDKELSAAMCLASPGVYPRTSATATTVNRIRPSSELSLGTTSRDTDIYHFLRTIPNLRIFADCLA